jgi:hypothetical protein
MRKKNNLLATKNTNQATYMIPKPFGKFFILYICDFFRS